MADAVAPTVAVTSPGAPPDFRRTRAKLHATIWSAACITAGLAALTYYGYHAAADYRGSLKFATTRGTVHDIYCRAETYQVSRVGDPSAFQGPQTHYRPDAFVEYEIDGKTYKQWVPVDNKWHDDRDQAIRSFGLVSEGSTQILYYDPKYPTSVRFSVGTRGLLTLAARVAIAALFFAVAAAAWAAFLWAYGSTKSPAAGRIAPHSP